MANDPQDQIDRLFSEALRRPEDQRAAFLQEHCAEADVRRKVQSLLEDYEAAADLFDGLADAAVAPMLSTLQGRGDPEGEFRGADPLDLEGTQVGRYQVEEHLGGGGMGVVYRARDPELSREVALKFLPPVLATSPEAEERFVREARAAAALGHSSIATIHEIGETDAGRRFIAMAYYEGETLKEKLDREGALPVEKALGYAEQIAEALARAHEAGIVHRDVKPANVMVTETGDAKLLDFGLAKAAAETRITETGRRMGTAAYMSPEQAEGQAIDGRTDVWALGVVLYEMLAGERPFRGERKTAVIHSILHEEPEPLREHRSEIPNALEEIVGGCLRKDPDERYDSAATLRDDLHALASDADALPAGGAPLGGRPRQSRRRRLIGGAVAVLLLLGAAATWMLWPGGGAPSEPDRSVAVLPFESVGQTESGVFTDGLHNGLLSRLSGIADLTVISPKSEDRYLDAGISRSAIADTLGARWIVEGDVRTVGNQIQVQARLVDPQTDAHLWAHRYRKALGTENLFAIEGDITREIAGALQAELTGEEKRQTERRPTDDLEAYQLYQQGRGVLKQRTDSTLKRSADLFRQAIARDSSFALAWAGLADALTFLAGYYGKPDPDTMLPKAAKAAHRAMELDPNLAEAHTSLGRLHGYRQQLPAALREANQAIELRPSYAVAHEVRAWTKLLLGRPDEALKSARRAVELDPLSPENRFNLALVLQYSGAFDRALKQVRRAQRIQPGYASGEIGYTLALAGRTEEALSTLDRDNEPQWMADYYRTLAGDTSAARRLLAEKEGPPPDMFEGLALAVLGRHEAATGAFRGAFHPLANTSPRIVRWSRYAYPTVLQPLRETPAFQSFVRDMNRDLGLSPDGSLPAEARSPTPSPSQE